MPLAPHSHPTHHRSHEKLLFPVMKIFLHILSALALALAATASFLPGAPFAQAPDAPLMHRPSTPFMFPPSMPFTYGAFDHRRTFTPYTAARVPVPFKLPVQGPIVRYTPAKGMTSYLNWYIPTYKCPGGWYCRANLAVFKRFDGKTEVRAGYSVWNFDSGSTHIPQALISSVGGTTFHEIMSYVDALDPAIKDGYQGTVCEYQLGDADNALQAAIHKLVAECKETTGSVCERDSLVKLC